MRNWACSLLSVLPLVLVPSVSSHAQQSQVTVKHMPDSTIAVVSLWPNQLAAKPRMQLAPLEVITAVGLEQVGIDPLQIARMDLMIPMPGMEPLFGCLVQMSVPFDLSQLNPDLLGDQAQ